MIWLDRSVPVQRKVALGGILAGFIMMSLVAAYLIPVNRLFFLAVSSLFVSIMIMKVDLLYAVLLYVATAVLAFFMIPSRSIALAYIVFFGVYGIIKFLCEQIRNAVISWTLKFAAFNVSLLILYFLVSLVFGESISSRLPLPLLWLGAQFVFLVYDIVYTMFIGFYHRRLERVLRGWFR
ncbi:hypothetical protein JOD02_000028 [Caldicoprobacter guelmensis]|uniref:hypothetical protein n=1 Tax=Caldicoprobacter guelmensis TaxID=1170224 RepID=UPI00195DFE73|nr:hypothetical protein [Caldicoprobacter guelmensis]MBM7581205.1 hypothetical protein [Caldicoprobacter guelmensis]